MGPDHWEMRTMISRIFVVIGLGAFVAGCNGNEDLRSVIGSECKIFERPEYAVLGKRRYDQDVIDEWVEGGVGGCKWKRPAKRPPELDAVPTKGGTAKPVVAPTQKPGLFKRIKARVLPKPRPEAVVTPVAPIPYLLPPVVVSAPPPMDPVDRLLLTKD